MVSFVWYLRTDQVKIIFPHDISMLKGSIIIKYLLNKWKVDSRAQWLGQSPGSWYPQVTLLSLLVQSNWAVRGTVLLKENSVFWALLWDVEGLRSSFYPTLGFESLFRTSCLGLNPYLFSLYSQILACRFSKALLHLAGLSWLCCPDYQMRSFKIFFWPLWESLCESWAKTLSSLSICWGVSVVRWIWQFRLAAMQRFMWLGGS